jgi:sulfite reductase (NADPH) flavoprotein alpha-component
MPITIIYGSETGNAEGFAETTAEKLQAAGFEATVLNMGDVKAQNLTDYSTVLVITSTWGDGEPPSNAWDLWGELGAKPKLDLSSVRYSVLALGDKSYAQFCKCGIDFDEWLTELGATRLAPRVDCDWDFEKDAQGWLETVTAQLKTLATV